MKEFTTFKALLKPITDELLSTAVSNYDSDYYSKLFKTKDHLIAMIYAQLHDLKSLRDLEIAFNSQYQLKQMLNCKEIK